MLTGWKPVPQGCRTDEVCRSRALSGGRALLELRNIHKRFGETVALADVSVTFAPGRVHGVLGENGAGKTTLMRIAAGLTRADRGGVALGGCDLSHASPVETARAGIAMVHQHFMLVPTLTVAENCMIGRRQWGWRPSRAAVAREIGQLAGRIGLEVDPFARIDSLTVGQQQRAEIVRALSTANKVLILDEPTAVLTPPETDQLFSAIRRLRDDGLAIVFISHKLDEVRRLCDELTILRRGACVYQGAAASLSGERMTEHMVGRVLDPLPPRDPPSLDAPVVLALDELRAADPETHRRIIDVSLSVRAGEIVGIAGVEGNGQDVLAATIAGVLAPSAGRITLDGRDISRLSARERVAAGLAHIAEDRLRHALVPRMSLRENLILKDYRSPAFGRHGLIRWRRVDAHAAGRLARFDVRGGALTSPVHTLSGGNQQKLVLARELAGSPRFILAQNPARGLDVAATRFVFEQLFAQRRRGAGILLIHHDLDELLGLADRVAVMYDGRALLTDWPDGGREAIARLMLGGAS